MQRQTAAFAVIAILIGGVAAERLSAQREAHRPQLSGTIRTYYIAADPVLWNYAPEGRGIVAARQGSKFSGRS